MTPIAVERHTNRHLLGEKSGGLFGAAAEREVRIPVVRQVPLERLVEVRPLVALGAQPAVAAVGQHGVQEHQALDEAAQRRGLSMTIIRLADRLVQRFVLHVKQPSAVKRARRDRRGVPGGDEPGEKVVRLLAMREAGERAVLPLQEHAREDEHMDQEPRLALGEPEPHEASNA